MVEITADLQQYVPTVTTMGEYMIIERGPITVILDDFHHILFGKKCSYLWGVESAKIQVTYFVSAGNYQSSFDSRKSHLTLHPNEHFSFDTTSK